MNSLILSVFFAAAAQTEVPPEEVVEVMPAPALVTVEIPAKFKKAYAYVDRVTVVEVNKEFELTAGKHEIVVLAPGYYDLSFEVEVKAGEKKKLAIRTMVPGYSTLDGLLPDAGSIVHYSFSPDWSQTSIHPWRIDGNSVIIDGNPLPGSRGMGIHTYNRFRSTEFVYRFEYSLERGAIDLSCNGKSLPASKGWHTVVLYASDNGGSYMLTDWTKYPVADPSTNISLKWKAKTNGRIVFRNFSFVDVAAQKAAATGN